MEMINLLSVKENKKATNMDIGYEVLFFLINKTDL